MQTHSTATKDIAVQCSLLYLSFLNESSVSEEEEHENVDEDNDTDISESESGEEIDVSYSEAVQYDGHLKRYEAHHICFKFDLQYRPNFPYHQIKKFMFFKRVCLHCLRSATIGR